MWRAYRSQLSTNYIRYQTSRSLSTTFRGFSQHLDPVQDRPIIHSILDQVLTHRQEGQVALATIKKRLDQYSQPQIISLMNQETAPNYAGSFPIVVQRTEGPWWVDTDGEYHLNVNTSYGAKRFPEFSEAHTGDLPSRAVYTKSQVMASLVSNTYARNAGVVDPLSLVLMSGSDVMKAAYDGVERVFNGNCQHIIFHNHFHGRAEFNSWEYHSDYYHDRGVIALPFTDHQALATQVRQLLEGNPEVGVGIYGETTQGEGGVHPMTSEMVTVLQELKQEFPEQIIVVADLVQRGIAGTDLWGLRGLQPDAIALSKSIINGNYPIGILAGTNQFMTQAFPVGSHGGTSSLREDACQELVDWFGFLTSTPSLDKLQHDTNQLLQVFQASPSDKFQVRTDGSAMIGITCQDHETAQYYQNRGAHCGEILRQNTLWCQHLLTQYTHHLSEVQVAQVKEFIDTKMGSMPMKIAGDTVTLRLSGQALRPVDLALYQIMCNVVFSLEITGDSYEDDL